MNKLLIITFLFLSMNVNAQTTFITDTIYPAIIGTDTFYHFSGHTSNIIGILIDCRTIDDTTGVTFNIGVGWELFDTTFVQVKSDELPLRVSDGNDYLVIWEKIGMAFLYNKILFHRAGSDPTKRYPIRITYDR